MASRRNISIQPTKPARKLWDPFWNSGQKRVRALFRIGLFVIVMELGALGLSVLMGIILRLFFKSQDNSLAATESFSYILKLLVNTILPLGGIIIAIWVSTRFLEKRKPKEFGFHFSKQWWMDFGFGLGLGIVLVSGIFLIERLSGLITVSSTTTSIMPGISFVTGFLLTVLFYFAIGIFEEILMRGVVLRNLAEGLNFWFVTPRWALLISYVLSSVVFGFLHFANPGFNFLILDLLSLAGLLLGLGFVLTGDLGISIGLHISWNMAMGALFGFPVSGIPSDFSLFRIQQGGPTWLTGGAFGPEAGVLGLIAMLLGAGVVLLYVRLTRKGIHWHEELAVYTGVNSEISMFDRKPKK